MSETTKPSLALNTFSNHFSDHLANKDLDGMAELALTAASEANYWRGVAQERAVTLAYLRDRVKTLEEREAGPSKPTRVTIPAAAAEGSPPIFRDRYPAAVIGTPIAPNQVTTI